MNGITSNPFGISRNNASGCNDPTAYEALTNAMRAECAAKAAPRPLPSKPRAFVYICSPYRGDTETNADNALRYCRLAVGQGKLPIAPHVWLPQFLDDNDKTERRLGLDTGLWLINLCSEVWVFGNKASEGMKAEIIEARRLKKNIRYFCECNTGIYETRRPPE